MPHLMRIGAHRKGSLRALRAQVPPLAMCYWRLAVSCLSQLRSKERALPSRRRMLRCFASPARRTPQGCVAKRGSACVGVSNRAEVLFKTHLSTFGPLEPTFAHFRPTRAHFWPTFGPLKPAVPTLRPLAPTFRPLWPSSGPAFCFLGRQARYCRARVPYHLRPALNL